MITKNKLAGFLVFGCLIGLFVVLTQEFAGTLGRWISLGLGFLSIAIMVAWRSPYWILMFLVIFIPLESFALKFMPGPSQVYLASQFISEFLVYLLFVVTLAKKILGSGSLRKTFVDIPFAIFIVGAAISIIINRAPPVASLMNIRSAIRYLALFYSVSNLELAPLQASRLMRALLFMGFLEIVVGIAQIVGGTNVYSFFAPRQSDVEFLGETRNFTLASRGREIGSIFGTLGDTLFFGLFMLIILAVYLGRITRITFRNLAVITILFIAIGFSYSRASFLGAVLMLFLWYIRFHRPRVTQVIAAGIALSIIAAAMVLVGTINTGERFVNPRLKQQNIIQNVAVAFSREYIDVAQNNRLGALRWVPPAVLQNAFWFGYGPDQATTIERLNQTDVPLNYKILKESGFEDVYWVAILAYYGVIGLLAFFVIFLGGIVSAWNIYLRAKLALTREVSVAVSLTWTLTLFLLFFYRALEFRVYAFFLWLLPAIMLSLLAYEKRYLPIREARHETKTQETDIPS